MKIINWNEEKILFDALEKEKEFYEEVPYISPLNQEEEKEQFKMIVETNVKRKKVINIRPLEADIIKIKSKALAKGIPYQTLINSVIHQFANDKLVEAQVY